MQDSMHIDKDWKNMENENTLDVREVVLQSSFFKLFSLLLLYSLQTINYNQDGEKHTVEQLYNRQKNLVQCQVTYVSKYERTKYKSCHL